MVQLLSKITGRTEKEVLAAIKKAANPNVPQKPKKDPQEFDPDRAFETYFKGYRLIDLPLASRAHINKSGQPSGNNRWRDYFILTVGFNPQNGGWKFPPVGDMSAPEIKALWRTKRRQYLPVWMVDLAMSAKSMPDFQQQYADYVSIAEELIEA